MANGDLHNAYKEYYDTLKLTGNYSLAASKRLLLFSFLQEMEDDGFVDTLDEKDRKMFFGLWRCLQRRLCIVPYTDACKTRRNQEIYMGGYDSCIYDETQTDLF